jgi:hypothetical protein
MKYGAIDLVKKADADDVLFKEMYNEPVFTDVQKKRHLENIEGFEKWFIDIVRK